METTPLEEARELRAHALAARESRTKAGIAYDSIQVPIDVVLSLTAPPTNEEREALIEAINSELGWDWSANLPERIPSSHAVLGEIADAVIAAGFRRQGLITDADETTIRRHLRFREGMKPDPARFLASRLRAALEAARDA